MSIENQETQIEITSATFEDTKGIEEVRYKAWLATYPNKEIGITEGDIHDKFQIVFTPEELKKREERIKNIPPNSVCLVAKQHGKVLGFIRVSKEDVRNQLNAIYILPEMHGKGVGRALWENALQFIDNSKDTFVEVASYNKKAIEFYRKLGFIETGRHWQDEKFKMKSGNTLPEIEMVRKVTK